MRALPEDVETDAVNFFRFTWDIKDIVACLEVLRSPHRRNEDTVKEYEILTTCIAIRDQWTALLE